MAKRSFFLLTVILLSHFMSNGQISHGGFPEGLDPRNIQEVPFIYKEAPQLPAERDSQTGKPGMPLHAGIGVKMGADVILEARQDLTGGGTTIYRLGIHIPGAEALGVYFEDFHIPLGGNLFVYDESGSYILGAFTEKNNRPEGTMAISLVPGDRIILEYDRPQGGSLPRLLIDEIAYHFLPFNEGSRGLSGASDFCEVNVNCSPEGDNWQDQKRGIARIYVKEGGSYFWCTGSLVNNERKDRTPYFLTADHCGKNASAQDYLEWIFYFNHESEDCEDPIANIPEQSMDGASLLASYDSDGSDFKLLLLRDEVPDIFNPYFNGWSNRNVGSDRGVSIHHPSGDIKKISTYETPLTSVSWSGIPGTHWRVRWSDTPNGHGVTEGGSSGAPIFNEEGYIIGTLTGGLAACEVGGSGPGTGPDEPDYYGKFSYSWASNGNSSSQRLKDWLDPDDTGIEELRGNNNFLEADFETTAEILLTGETIEFTDISSGIPNFYRWEFEGGEPGTYSESGPVNVRYPVAGTYDVSLIVADDETTDTLFREDYIRVVAQLYPNPSNSQINVFVGNDPPEYIRAEIVDLSGKLLYDTKIKDNVSSILSFDVSFLSAGVYVVRLTMNQRFSMYKFIVPPSF